MRWGWSEAFWKGCDALLQVVLCKCPEFHSNGFFRRQLGCNKCEVPVGAIAHQLLLQMLHSSSCSLHESRTDNVSSALESRIEHPGSEPFLITGDNKETSDSSNQLQL